MGIEYPLSCEPQPFAGPAPSVLRATLDFDRDRVDTIDPTHDVEQDEIAMACDVSQ